MTATLPGSVDRQELDNRIVEMYRAVAEDAAAPKHFEVGRALAERLGYPPEQLDGIPAGAVDSFAGVGYFLDLAALRIGEAVLDLGSGSGMDSLLAARHVGASGRVVGIDMTPAQLARARRLATEGGLSQASFVEGRIEGLPFADGEFDAVISNGVINLSADKAAVFAEASRVLRPGGRLALADIVSRVALPESIVCNAALWASCIGGATQIDAYRSSISGAGFSIEAERAADYAFLSEQARQASATYGVTAVVILARKVPGGG